MQALRHCLLCVAIALPSSTALLRSQNLFANPPVSARVDERDFVLLRGNTVPMARPEFDRGRVSDDLPMQGLMLVMARSPERQAAFDKFVASQSDPESANFHHWLTPEQIGEQFGPAETDLESAESWLRVQGFAVQRISKDRMAIHFSGTAGIVKSAFRTEIHNLDVHGERHIANMSDPRIPAELGSVVFGLAGLNDFTPRPALRLGSKARLNREQGIWERVVDEAEPMEGHGHPRPEFGISIPPNRRQEGSLIEDLTPYDFAMIYNVKPLWDKGIDGTGETIAVVGADFINPGDLTVFRKMFGLPPVPSFRQVQVNNGNPEGCSSILSSGCTAFGGQTASTVSVEWASAIAKGANIVLVISGQPGFGPSIDTVYLSSEYVVENRIAEVLNVNYSVCELFESTAGNTAFNNLWQTANAEGISVVTPTGEAGSASCDETLYEPAGVIWKTPTGHAFPYAGRDGLSVNALASSPYATAVGGTDFKWCEPGSSSCTAAPYWNSRNDPVTGASAKGYIPEVAWNQSCANPLLLPELRNAAGAIGVPEPTDAESACNFINGNYDTVDKEYGIDLSPLVDTYGGGGGASNCTTNNTSDVDGTIPADPSSCSGGYGKPTWQTGLPGIPADGKRDLPDVSFFASVEALNSAYLICSTENEFCTYSDTAESTAQEAGGTAIASAAMAGVMALINQKASGPVGNPNAELYKLAASQASSACSAERAGNASACYFQDVDRGNNSQPCESGTRNCQAVHSGDRLGVLPGFQAGKGYDLATGLGSLNVARVVDAWPDIAAPIVTLSADILGFETTALKTSSKSQTITLNNIGHGTLKFTGPNGGIVISGGGAKSFLATKNCGEALAAGGSCQIYVVFRPETAQALDATISFDDNAFGAGGPLQSVQLAGIGVDPVVKLSTFGISFPDIAIGKSASAKIILSNTGKGQLSLSGSGRGITITGANPKSFAEKSSCGASLAAGSSCTIAVSFTPVKTGSLSATLQLFDDAPNSPQKVLLSGAGR